MKPLVTMLLLIVLSIGLIPLAAQETDYQTIRIKAESSYAEGSYSRAHDLYTQAARLRLTSEEKRWVDFRLADTQWRAESATHITDNTKLEEAQHALEVLIRDIQRPQDRDSVWAEVEESLGDFYWMRPDLHNWGQAWSHYQEALDWWAGSTGIEQARHRYLAIVWKMARPSFPSRYYSYGDFGNAIPLDVLQNALAISATDNDKAHAHYLIAETFRTRPADSEQRQRVGEEFEAALRFGKSTDWYDDALFHYAQWLESGGRVYYTETGELRTEPDFVKALQVFKQFLAEFRPGESRYYEQAKQEAEEIVRPGAEVHVSNIFLPGSEIQFELNWRNVSRVDFTLFKLDLPGDVAVPSGQQTPDNWVQSVNLSGREAMRKWSRDTHDKGDHRPGSDTVRLEEKLPIGAYLLLASADGISSRELVLVTDASLVLKTSGTQALVYFSNAFDGSPIAHARVALREASYDYRSRTWTGRRLEKSTDDQGLAIFDLSRGANQLQIFASAAIADRQAFALGYSSSYSRPTDFWRIYAFADRPAYRPGEDVHWKFTARRYNGNSYSTPANQKLDYEITDPRGSSLRKSSVTMNAFGSAWGTIETTGKMPLGEYQITFREPGSNNPIGTATLFRLEEYKLPEFKVSVQTPEEDGKKKTYRLGDSVNVVVQSDYYFGAPVTDAKVEVSVYQNYFYHSWHRPHEYPWYYEDTSYRPRYWAARQGQVIKHDILKTDVHGRATLSFDTPRDTGQDYEYTIEARVTDSSRREIVGSGTVRVTRQRYYVYARPQHYLYSPKDKVTINIKALDANDQPVQVDGLVQLSRDHWYEIWIDPDGREVKGEELKQAQRKYSFFPPPPDKNGRTWALKFRGYEHEDILAQPVSTDAAGNAEFTFTPDRVGFYRLAWSSKQKGGPPIKTETTVWVADNATTALGYHHEDVEVIVDKDTFRAGQTAPVMLTAPAADRYVLFSIEGDNLYHYQLVHLTGNVKLLEVPVEEKFVPNIFLSAILVNDCRISMDTKEVVVPPLRNFLDVDVKADRDQYQPRQKGTLNITTRDSGGKPVSAEVALGLIDESVYYIQPDYAGDPRQFYFGSKRWNQIQNQSTFNQRSYIKLVEGPDKNLINERWLGTAQKREGPAGIIGGVVGGVAQAVAGEPPGSAKSVSDIGTASRPVAAEMRAAIGKEGAMPAPAPPPSPGKEPSVQVRSDFRSTVFWQPDIITDQDGKATVTVTYPDSLTTWKATARVESTGSQFGIASTTARTQQPLIVRLQAPRFFLVGDKVTLSAVMNNNTDQPMTVVPFLETQGLDLVGKVESTAVDVPPNGEVRTDWLILVRAPGEARVRVTARGKDYSDAMERTFPVYEHGIEKFITKSGKMRSDEVDITLDLPRDRKKESTVMTVQIAPSMAVTMLDALPYLLHYPYGCTEQTMSRFLPAAITAKTLRDLGVSTDTVMKKIFGGIVPESAQPTHAQGRQDLGRLNEIIQQGLERLYDFQHGDGGWGWWKEGETDSYMTAYVVWGLSLAREADLSVRAEVLSRAAGYLNKELVNAESQYDLQSWMLFALSEYRASLNRPSADPLMSKAFDNLWKNKDQLNAYTRSLLALTAHNLGYSQQALTLVRNLENGVKIDKAPDVSILEHGRSTAAGVLATAHWGADGVYWHWSEGSIESTAFALRALLMVDPQNRLIEPVTNWLIKNRRGAQWSDTRDTAITVLALNDYLRVSGELRPHVEYALDVNGHSIAARTITGDDSFSAPTQFLIDLRYLQDGPNHIRIKRLSGESPLYFSIQARYFSLEEPIPSAGNEIFVRRQYFKLVGHPTLLKGYVYDRQPLNDGDSVASNDRIQVVLTIEAKNDYEYLVFEDLKPAGLEAVKIRSGESLFATELKKSSLEARKEIRSSQPTVHSSDMASPEISDQDYTGRARWVYQELRDRKVAFFIDKLPQGFWEIRYDLRAEVPGHYHALPVVGYAMYVPEIRANGNEVRITVLDQK